ncbi:MAG: twin-arginine translocation signal domain-containing protein [Acidobacteria bacterium]|nr:twin-arginine translocation signal domain-containing protein [Acidobacteriota bacterium]
MNRRQFLAGAAALPAAAAPVPDFSSVRKDFPRALNETYFNSAAQHPLGVHAMRAMQRYMDFMTYGPGEGRSDFWEEGFLQVKPLFAGLMRAAGSRRPGRQASRLADRAERHGARRQQQDAADRGLAGLLRQRPSGGHQSAERSGPRPWRAAVRRHHPGGRRDPHRRESHGYRSGLQRHVQMAARRAWFRLHVHPRGSDRLSGPAHRVQRPSRLQLPTLAQGATPESS